MSEVAQSCQTLCDPMDCSLPGSSLHGILQARVLEWVKGTRNQIVNIRWIIKKAREFQKNIYFCFINYAKVFDCVDHNKLWKILQEMGIPDHLTCLLKNLYSGQEATIRTGRGTTDWFLIRKGEHQVCILSLYLFNFHAEFIMQNTALDEAQAGLKMPGEISITSVMQMTPPLLQKLKN